MAGTSEIYVPPEQCLMMKNWIRSKLKNQPKSVKNFIKTYLTDLIDNAPIPVPPQRKRLGTFIHTSTRRSTFIMNGTSETNLTRNTPQITINTQTSIVENTHEDNNRNNSAKSRSKHQSFDRPVSLKQVIEKYSRTSVPLSDSRKSLKTSSITSFPSFECLETSMSNTQRAHFSEFSSTNQSFCFPKTQRKLDFSTDKSPGPAFYDAKSTLNTVGTKINKSSEPRSSFLNPQSYNPAPTHYYPTQHFLSK